MNHVFPFWAKLTDEERAKIESACYTEIYEKGSLMHRTTDNCKGLMTVVSGLMRTYIVSEEGREITLFRIHDGEVCVLSASCLMDSIAFDVMIEASERTEVLILPSVVLNRIMQDNPYVELYMYKTAADKFSEVMWTMQQLLFQKIDQRVAGFLLEESQRTGETTLHVTHEEIAKCIGSAREVVTRVLKYLAEAGIIALGRGKIEILDRKKLLNL